MKMRISWTFLKINMLKIVDPLSGLDIRMDLVKWEEELSLCLLRGWFNAVENLGNEPILVCYDHHCIWKSYWRVGQGQLMKSFDTLKLLAYCASYWIQRVLYFSLCFKTTSVIAFQTIIVKDVWTVKKIIWILETVAAVSKVFGGNRGAEILRDKKKKKITAGIPQS